MKRLLALVAAACFAIGAFFAIAAGMAGVAWIFIFGDDSWPWWSSAVIFVPALLVGVFLAVGLYRAIMAWSAPPRAS